MRRPGFYLFLMLPTTIVIVLFVTSLMRIQNDSVSAQKKGQDSLPTSAVYRREEIFTGFGFNMPRRIQRDKSGNFFILDVENNRIVVFDSAMKFVRQIGQIGQGPEDLYSPGDYHIDSRDHIYVVDVGNNRLQVFDPLGKRIGGFPLDVKATAIVVNSKGDILLNQPHKGNLVSVYSRDGKLIRRFGQLLTTSHAYPGRPNDEKSGLPISRVRFVIDEQDNLYVTYIFAPLLQKYDAAGKLLWEARLAGPEIAPLVKAFWENPKVVASMSIDGIQMAIICWDIAFDHLTHRVYLMLGNRDLYVTDEFGKKISVGRENKKGWSFNSMTVINGVLHATSFDNRCFRLVFH